MPFFFMPFFCHSFFFRVLRSFLTNPAVWNSAVAFRDVDYLDMIGIDLKAVAQLGQDVLIGSLEFQAHEVLFARVDPPCPDEQGAA